ncbi:RrF2 family transcriptional regulator [Baileyella intestinalis]|uniref:RrF2 family transcriptional regulator n=1 Tax=Baileyella intestinalis TaxID=2606709 RepID=UPI0022E6EF6E|nr:Rrf2 family transcriptional regulator [Baileyella intestinalis]
MDTKFSSAIHTLILISESPLPMTSDDIAASVGTNASYIRKLTALMKKAGIIDSHRGRGGFSLAKDPEKVTFAEIYCAVMEVGEIHVFDIHQNPNDSCIVGKNIQPVLGDMFHEMERELSRSLEHMTLAGCISKMKNRIKKEDRQ